MSWVVLAGAVAAGSGAVGVIDLLSDNQSRRKSEEANSRPVRLLLRGITWLGSGFTNRAPQTLPLRLSGAGLATPPAHFMALKAGAALLALVSTATLLSDLGTRIYLTLSLVLPTVVFFTPDLWLRRRTQARAQAINAEIPEVLELLRVALAAGLGLRRALAEVGARQHGLLAQEFNLAARALACGETHERVINSLQRRCPTPLVTALTTVLTRTHRHGTPLTEPLATIIHSARADRSRQAMEAAARAAPKIQLVVALLLVPSVMLLITATLLPIFMHK